MKIRESLVPSDINLETLRKTCPIGSKIITTIVHTSRSGSTHFVRLFSVLNGMPFDITLPAASVINARCTLKPNNDVWVIKERTSGMNLQKKLVYRLSFKLHGDFFALTQVEL